MHAVAGVVAAIAGCEQCVCVCVCVHPSADCADLELNVSALVEFELCGIREVISFSIRAIYQSSMFFGLSGLSVGVIGQAGHSV